jgi:hypothetical protein
MRTITTKAIVPISIGCLALLSSWIFTRGHAGPAVQLEALVGMWKATDRHASHGSLYQPIHEARRREALVYFEQVGGQLTGHSETPNYKQISEQGNWDGRTEFKRVYFSNNQLRFEFDIADWTKLAPFSEELIGQDHKGTIRVEAQLMSNRLVGRWGIFTKAGAEIFRGEWVAARAEEPKAK